MTLSVNNSIPVAWTIAGSDTCSGAGMQTDLLTFNDFKVHGCTVITALTAQDPKKVYAIDTVQSSMVTAQLEALIKNFFPQAIKLGMLSSAENMSAIASFLRKIETSIILDPVMISSSGALLMEPDAILVLKRELLPITTLLTPNIPETEALVNFSLESKNAIESAAQKLLKMGVKAVLIKGGHTHSELASDYYSDGIDEFWIHTKRTVTGAIHGTGCLLSAGITAALALGYALKDAIVLGKFYLNQSMRLPKCVASGETLLGHRGFPNHSLDLPWISNNHCGERYAFQSLRFPIGFYPIIDNVEWLQQLLQLGVKTLQLRIKNITDTTESEIITAIQLAKKFDAQLFINDHWQFAIKHGAYGVHLGQEDLDQADLTAIRNAGLRLGISTHSFFEVARAHQYQPSYIAFGPIYETSSKVMTFSARGLLQLEYWHKCSPYPLVAIGGIDLSRVDAVLATGVKNIAVISAVTKAENVEHAVMQFLEKISSALVS